MEKLTESKTTIAPEDLFEYRFLHHARLAPDGKRVAYTVSYVDTEENKEYITIWLLSLETGESRQLTAGLTRDSNPQWSPDGTQIAFLRQVLDGGRSNPGRKPQIYLISVDGGEARALTDMPQGVGGGPVWSPNGKHLAFTARSAKELPDADMPYRVTRHLYRFNGMGYLDSAVEDIYIIPVEGGEPRQLTDDACHNSAPVWSPDGQEILFNVTMYPDSYRREPALKIVNIDGQIRDLVKDWGSAGAANWTPDGEQVVFIGNPLDCLSGTQSNLWVIDRQGGVPECRTESLEAHLGGILQYDMPALPTAASGTLVTKDGQAAYVCAHLGGTLQAYRISLKGAESHTSVVSSEGRSCIPLDVDDEQLLFAVGSVSSPFDLFVANIDGTAERQLTRLNADLLAELQPPILELEHLLFPSADGVEIEGWLLKPAVSEPPYPTILYIHGGPHVAWGHMFSFDFQMLTSAGYAMLLINYRGSTGYGDEFSTQINGNPGDLEHKDLMTGVDWVIERGLADPERLGCVGGSYGGYLTCWAVTHTNSFKAAMAQNSVTNWVSHVGTSDLAPGWDTKKLGISPAELPDLYRRCSPITYAHHCRTPTLLIVGEADYRCVAEQSEQFYTALKANGCIVEMLRFPHSPHAGSRSGPLPVRLARNEALLDWMNRYLWESKASEEPAQGVKQQ